MENRFIIDSDNYIKTKLFGYMILDDGKIIEEYNGSNSGNGCYCLVINKNNNIEIYQDNIGCFGIYLFLKDDYFALSNNLLYLINYLKGKLTLNKSFFKKLINAREVAFPPDQTICNEIKRITSPIKIINGKINIENKKEEQFSINCESDDYLKILDKWYFKWLNVFRNIYKENIIQDLSGGIDTRILLSMALNSNTYKSILFKTKKYKNNQESFEDFIIAKKIIKHFNLSELIERRIFKIPEDINNNFIFGNSNFSSSIRNIPLKKTYRICGNGSSLYHKSNTFKNLLTKRFYNVDEWLKKEYKLSGENRENVSFANVKTKINKLFNIDSNKIPFDELFKNGPLDNYGKNCNQPFFHLENNILYSHCYGRVIINYKIETTVSNFKCNRHSCLIYKTSIIS